MAINIPIITEFADQGLKSAQGAFATFRQKVGEAEGGMGKFKAAGGVAMDSIKANAGAMALGAGAAIAGFAAKAIGDFKDLALSVDEFRNTTGLTLDQSSQWVSYTGDLGIQAESMVKIFNRLGKAATDQLPAFKELGVEIAFGPDGTADLEATFLRVNDAINSLDDPVAQAKYRADLFGRGWMDAAELINMSSTEIQSSLAGVKDFEVIDEAEIRKAKDLRAAQDELGDAFLRLSVTLGEALIPGLTALSKVLIPVLEALAKFNGTLDEGMAGAIQKAQDMGHSLSDIARELGINSEQSLRYMADVLGISLEQLYQKLDRDLVPELYFTKKALQEGTRAMIDARYATEDFGDELISVDDALAELKGNIDDRREWDNLINAIEDAKEAAIDAFFEATPEALRESQRETDEARLKVAEYIAQMDEIPEEKKTEMIAALDRANLDEIEATFNHLARSRAVNFYPTVNGRPIAPGETPSEVLGRDRMSLRSSRRPDHSGQLKPGVDPVMGNVSSDLGAGLLAIGGRREGNNVVVNVAGSVISERDIVERIRKGLVDSQRNGAGLVYSNQ